jgi:hypothetical protein
MASGVALIALKGDWPVVIGNFDVFATNRSPDSVLVYGYGVCDFRITKASQ